MTVLVQNKTKECNCGTILAIFIIFIKLQKLLECLENLYLNFYSVA